MVLVAASVKIHHKPLKIVSPVESGYHNVLLLGHLVRSRLCQQHNTVVGIIFPVFPHRHNSSVLQHAYGSHKISVDIAVQPAEKVLPGL